MISRLYYICKPYQQYAHLYNTCCASSKMLNFDAVFLSLRQKIFFQFIVKNIFGNTATRKELNTYFSTFHFTLQLIIAQGVRQEKELTTSNFVTFKHTTLPLPPATPIILHCRRFWLGCGGWYDDQSYTK